jgi:tyrosyl-tRNA synthetase
LQAEPDGLGIATALTQAGLTASNSEAFRLISQGAVRIDGERISERGLTLPAGFSGVLQVGKRRMCKLQID